MTQQQELLDSITRLLGPARACPHGVVVSLAGCSVRFRCDLPRGIQVTRTILGPYCTITEPSSPVADTTASSVRHAGTPWTVISAWAEDLPATMERLVKQLAAAAAPRTEIRRWAGDFSADRYDLAPGHCVIVHRQPFTGLDVFSRDDRELFYLRCGPDFDVPHSEHVIKYPLRVALRETGFSQVHAAGCQFRGKGLLYLGEKGQGKSTLLVQTMSRGAKQVSNDLGYIRPGADGGCEMIAFPHMTRVAPGTVGDSERLRTGLARESRTHDYLQSPVFNGGKEEFYFPVLERLWGTRPVCHRTPLDAIIFPALDLGCTAASARPLRPAEVRDRLLESLVDDPPLPDWLPFHTGERFRSLAVSAAERVLTCAPPAFELRFGPSFTDPVSAIESVLDRL